MLRVSASAKSRSALRVYAASVCILCHAFRLARSVSCETDKIMEYAHAGLVLLVFEGRILGRKLLKFHLINMNGRSSIHAPRSFELNMLRYLPAPAFSTDCSKSE